MRIRYFKIKNFRNFESIGFDSFSDRVNIFCGENAQGKTNIIEALNYLSCARSFRSASIRQMIKDGEKQAFIEAGYEVKSHKGRINAKLFYDEKRSIAVNGLPVRKTDELLGVINTVVFSPDNLQIVKEGPSHRRKLMDVELSKIYSSYYADLKDYNTALKNKNMLLKERAASELIEVYNDALAKTGARIVARRAEFINEINKNAVEIHSDLSGGAEELGIKYKACCDYADAYASLIKKFEAVLPREQELCMSIFGPHREDLEITLNGKDARLYASQGQQRTALLSVKLAIADAAEELTGEAPILLLDDVMSELDSRRRKRLIDVIQGKQAFITCVDSESVPESGDTAQFLISEGTTVRKKDF